MVPIGNTVGLTALTEVKLVGLSTNPGLLSTNWIAPSVALGPVQYVTLSLARRSRFPVAEGEMTSPPATVTETAHRGECDRGRRDRVVGIVPIGAHARAHIEGFEGSNPRLRKRSSGCRSTWSRMRARNARPDCWFSIVRPLIPPGFWSVSPPEPLSPSQGAAIWSIAPRANTATDPALQVKLLPTRLLGAEDTMRPLVACTGLA